MEQTRPTDRSFCSQHYVKASDRQTGTYLVSPGSCPHLGFTLERHNLSGFVDCSSVAA